MNIDIEKIHLQRIVELAFLGFHVISEVYDDEKVESEYNESIQIFYEGIVENNGGEEFIHLDKDLGVYIESPNIEKKVFKEVLEEYNENAFADILPHQLALRDALLEYSNKSNYNLADFYQKVKDLEEAYNDEFEENGLDRLRIVDDETDDEDETFEHQIYV